MKMTKESVESGETIALKGHGLANSYTRGLVRLCAALMICVCWTVMHLGAQGKSNSDHLLTGNSVVAPETLDFGPIDREAEQRTLPLFISNCGNSDVQLPGPIISGPDARFFRAERTSRISIPRRQRIGINITFRPPPPQDPALDGLKTATLQINGREDTIRVELRAVLFQDRFAIDSVYIPAISGKVGDTVNVPVILAKFGSRSYALSRANSARIAYTINASVLIPADISDRAPIVRGQQTILQTRTINRTTDLEAGDTIFTMPMIVMLGEQQQSQISIITFTWNTPPNNLPRDTLLSPVARGNGNFVIEDVYVENGIPRLLNPSRADLVLEVSPNPVQETVLIRSTSAESDDDQVRFDDVQLLLFNSRGEVVRNLTDLLPQENGVVEFSSALPAVLPTGLYFLRLSINANAVTRLVIKE